jgi:hypothetical protein
MSSVYEYIAISDNLLFAEYLAILMPILKNTYKTVG